MRFSSTTFAPLVISTPSINLTPLWSGGIVVAHEWLSIDLTARLRADALSLKKQGAFSLSGLRDNSAALSHGGGSHLQEDKRDRLVRTITSDLGGDAEARKAFDAALEALCTKVQADKKSRPGRGGYEDISCEEQYYSISREGASLGWHMDERHEDTKGERGWSSVTRRSISWLVYLGSPQWGSRGIFGSGGQLVARCRGAARACSQMKTSGCTPVISRWSPSCFSGFVG